MKKILYTLAVVLAFASCQKVIDVDLNESNPQVAIEANYTAEDSTVRVHVSLTSSYFDASTSPAIDNAIVTIKDHLGNVSNVTSIGNGDFQLDNYVPIFNTTYTMNVVYNGTNYEAQCDMPAPVELSPITYEFTPGFFGLEEGYLVYMNVNDPPNVENDYLIVLTRNGKVMNQLPDMILHNDDLTDGNYVERPLFVSEFYDLGDVIGMELRSLDPEIYDYYEEVISIASGGGGAAPANPTTNWNNKALGYFSAYSNSREEVTIQ